MSMNPKHKKVIDYIIAFQCPNVRAYMKFYPNSSYDAARDSVTKLLAIPCNKEYYENEQKRLAEKLNATKEDNLKWLVQARDADILEAFDNNQDGFKNLEDIPPILRKISNEVEKIDGRYKLKLPSKLQCIKIINEMLGHNAATRHEIKQSVETVITGKVFTIEDLETALGEKKTE